MAIEKVFIYNNTSIIQDEVSETYSKFTRHGFYYQMKGQFWKNCDTKSMKKWKNKIWCQTKW